MHDVFVAVLRSGNQLRDDAPAGLLLRVATNVCLNRLRAGRRRPAGGAGDDDLVLQIAATADDGEARAAARGICWAGCSAPTIPWRRRPRRWRSCIFATA